MIIQFAKERYPKYLSSIPSKDNPYSPHLSPQPPLSVATLVQIPLDPNLKANTFPKVTNIFFQLALSKFIYQQEADNLEYLVRLSVQLGVQISHSSGFSRGFQGAPKQPKYGRLSQCSIPIYGQHYSRYGAIVKNGIELSLGTHTPSPYLLVFPLNIHVLGW